MYREVNEKLGEREMIRRYTFKLYPTAGQTEVLHERRKQMAELWNALLQRCEDVYRRERRMLNYFDLSAEITDLRRECPEWRDIPVGTSRRVAKSLTLAFKAFFRRIKAGDQAAGYPRYHRRDLSTGIPLGEMSTGGWNFVQRTDNPLSWHFTMKSITTRPSGEILGAPFIRLSTGGGLVPNTIHARGRFPTEVIDMRTADVLWMDGRWWLSVCVKITARRQAGEQHHTPIRSSARRIPGGRCPVRGGAARRIEFNLIDELALVDGIPEMPAELVDAQMLQDDLDRMKSELARQETERRRVTHLAARIARKRRNALHVWTARIVACSTDLTIVAPPVKPSTESPRGDKRNWGAAVEPVSDLNRHVLSLAPATAIAMLVYKSEEAGVRCDVITDEDPEIAVGRDLVASGKELRRASRRLKEAA